MLGKGGERMLIAILALFSFSVLVQVFTVEYLDLDDDSASVRNAKIPRRDDPETEPDPIRNNNIDIENGNGNGNRTQRQRPTILEDVQLRDLEDILGAAQAGVTEDERQRIPSKAGVVEMYGSNPVILGLERCEEFRRTVKPEDAFIAPAGMFNTGTNLLTNLLRQNCHNPAKMAATGPENIGMRGQVPWGKHSPATYRFHHTAKDQIKVPQSDVLAAAIIKDPYTWMNSMCRHSYQANWAHDREHCPNLVPLTETDRKGAGGRDTVPVKVRYSPTDIAHHDNLASLWNDWYGLWTGADFPRLVVRFEDLLFHAEEVVGKVCECGGGVIHTGDHFRYIEESAKKGGPHQGSNGLVKSVISYGNETRRVAAYRSPDLEYARANLSRDLLEMFRYSDPIV